MKIESERLYLYPISNEEMELLIAKEKDEEMKQAYAQMLQGCLASPSTRIWNAVWYMELKDSRGTIPRGGYQSGGGNHIGQCCFQTGSASGRLHREWSTGRGRPKICVRYEITMCYNEKNIRRALWAY